MTKQTPRSFNHFSLVAFTPSYWALPVEERRRVHRAWLDGMRNASETIHVYQTFGAESETDLLVWSAVRGDDETIPARFLAALARAYAPARTYLTLRQTLWGFTRPSQYTKVRSAQELDPFTGERLPYLIMYPFVKTASWYLKSREERQQMMLRHVKVGKQYKDITQLLLYSFGLQDQEFVVVYETHDLNRFLQLVEELRSTEARLYTERDTPLHLGTHQRDEEALASWL